MLGLVKAQKGHSLTAVAIFRRPNVSWTPSKAGSEAVLFSDLDHGRKHEDGATPARGRSFGRARMDRYRNGSGLFGRNAPTKPGARARAFALQRAPGTGLIPETKAALHPTTRRVPGTGHQGTGPPMSNANYQLDCFRRGTVTPWQSPPKRSLHAKSQRKGGWFSRINTLNGGKRRRKISNSRAPTKRPRDNLTVGWEIPPIWCARGPDPPAFRAN